MSPAAQPGPASPGHRPDAAWPLGVAAWLTAVAATVSLLVVAGPPAGLLVAGVLVVVAPALAHPHQLDRVVAAVVGLLLLPVVVLIGLVVGLTSRGPVLVRERDDDIRGLPVLRFRTTALEGPAGTTATGSRLTRVGHVLRTSCLDELPRLIAVARGEVALHRPGRR